MELIEVFNRKKIFFVCLLYTLFCCKGNNKEEFVANDLKSDAKISNSDASCFVDQKCINKNDLNGFVYEFQNEIVEVVSGKNSTNDFVINGEKYLSNLTLESADLNLYYYKCSAKKIFLFEGDDYYSSTIFAYLFENKNLYYLGNFIISQPNVEKTGVKKKDFKISTDNNQIYIEVLLNSKSFKTYKLNERKSISKETQITSKIDLSGIWRLNCENSLTTFEISGMEGYMSLYSDNAIFINVELVGIENKLNEYYVRFKGTESQQKYYEDKKNTVDSEISKTQNIGRLVLKDNNILFYWNGLYNDKTKKRDFVDDFVMLKENAGKNPIVLKKCEE
ncbi:hypothetical protein BSF41_45390 [Flavobacterium sp. ACN2]|jgi:hypothetical protein|uniref:hypothetical protein n=1 Tax=Flavobacterium sp. ACN2 TaxID=1975676 RepID=UPI000BB30886|nr:hypothetical protein [Flavobacterium sp. ACN2]PBI83349.1 hypothetical protein BSF41_45390 [Flavobacterium sp. ACN2]